MVGTRALSLKQTEVLHHLQHTSWQSLAADNPVNLQMENTTLKFGARMLAAKAAKKAAHKQQTAAARAATQAAAAARAAAAATTDSEPDMVAQKSVAAQSHQQEPVQQRPKRHVQQPDRYSPKKYLAAAHGRAASKVLADSTRQHANAAAGGQPQTATHNESIQLQKAQLPGSLQGQVDMLHDSANQQQVLAGAAAGATAPPPSTLLQVIWQMQEVAKDLSKEDSLEFSCKMYLICTHLLQRPAGLTEDVQRELQLWLLELAPKVAAAAGAAEAAAFSTGGRTAMPSSQLTAPPDAGQRILIDMAALQALMRVMRCPSCLSIGQLQVTVLGNNGAQHQMQLSCSGCQFTKQFDTNGRAAASGHQGRPQPLVNQQLWAAAADSGMTHDQLALLLAVLGLPCPD
jgi:hypothetical protein